MNPWIWMAAFCICAGMAAHTLDVGLKLRLAFALAKWSALAWIGLRVAFFTVSHTVA